MRILLVTRDFPPHASAGTEVYTLSLALGLRQLGHDINVVCVGRWNEDPTYFNGATEDIHRGINVSRLHLNWLRAPDPNRYLYNNPLVAAFMKDYVSEFNPDVVHVTSCDRISASVIPTLKQMGFPVVLSLTDFWFICPLFNLVRFDNATCNGQTTPWECLRCTTHGTKVYRGLSRLFPAKIVQFILTRISHHPTLTRQRGLRGMAFDMQDRKDYMLSALRQADYVMIATPFGRELFRAIVPDKDIHYVPYGHNLHWLKRYRGKTPTRTLRIAYVGRLDESKGAHLLLEAFRQLPGNANVELEIYGNMPENSTVNVCERWQATTGAFTFWGGTPTKIAQEFTQTSMCW